VYLGSKEIPGEEDLEQTLEELIKNSKAKEVAMTVAEYFETKGQIKGRQEGEQIGIQKGEQIGIQKEKREMARRMKSKGVSISDIALFTGLAEEEIKKL
jgi:predicted transposase/invertase (TIGR01784 family)